MNFLKKNLNKIICSDSIIGLNKIEDNSVDMVITSPPYDQLRDYEKNLSLSIVVFWYFIDRKFLT